MAVRAVLEELVVPRAKDEQVGLVVEQLLDNDRLAIRRIGDPGAVDHPPVPAWVGGAEAELEPGRERGLDRERMPLNRRAPQAENAELIRPLDRVEFGAPEELLVRPRDLVTRPLLVPLEQRTDRAEADERVVMRTRPAPGRVPRGLPRTLPAATGRCRPPGRETASRASAWEERGRSLPSGSGLGG